MLTSLRRGFSDKAAEQDAIDLLVECHGRIRQFTNIASRLANAEGAFAEEIREAASRLIRYFTIALPLHSEDEEQSLLPRLIAAESGLREALEQMAAEHLPIHATIDEQVLAWRELVEAPSKLAELAPSLKEGAAALARLFDEHLAKEESVIFPAARRCLDAEAIAEIFGEMRARREGRGFG